MAKKTTVKPISLGYRTVGSQANYTPLTGVLKGLTVGQDEPDSTEIEAEFFDSPFYIFYDGNPVTMTFELANYELSELPNLFGGSVANGNYEASPTAHTSEWEWKLDFSHGHSALVIYKGLTIGTLKKDADGALNYSVTITALVYNDGTTNHMYKIVGSGWTNPYPNARIELDGLIAPMAISEVVTDFANTDNIKIYGLTESNVVTASNSLGSITCYFDAAGGNAWEIGGSGEQRPIDVFVNGAKWFTIVEGTWTNLYQNATLEIDSGEYDITQTVASSIETPDFIIIGGVGQGITISGKHQNGESQTFAFAQDKWQAGTGVDLPLDIYANGQYWFTIVYDEG